jgi:hypothetical protein
LLIFVEPPSADPHAVVMRGGARQRAGLPDLSVVFGFDSSDLIAENFSVRVYLLRQISSIRIQFVDDIGQVFL